MYRSDDVPRASMNRVTTLTTEGKWSAGQHVRAFDLRSTDQHSKESFDYTACVITDTEGALRRM